MSDDDEESAAELAASASGLPMVGADPDELAFAQVKLPQSTVLAVFRPDFEEGERMAWYHVGCCLRTPCLWPFFLPLYPWLVGCARYSTKVIHETFYVATEDGIITLVNDFETRFDECCSPRVHNELRRWEDIEEIIERRGGNNSVLGDSGVFFKLSDDAQKATNTVGEVWYVTDPAGCVRVLRRLHRRQLFTGKHLASPIPPDYPDRSSSDEVSFSKFSLEEKCIYVCRHSDPSTVRSCMVHDDMSMRAFRALVLYALDYDLPASTPVSYTLRGKPVTSCREVEENETVYVHIG